MRGAKEETFSSGDRRKSWWSRVALVLPMVAILGGCKGEAKVEQEIVRPVRVAVVGEAVRGHRLTYSGVVRPRIESAIGFRVAAAHADGRPMPPSGRCAGRKRHRLSPHPSRCF